MNNKLQLFFSLYLSLSLVSCSAIMAASGQRDPNLDRVRIGATRGEVELELGKPAETEKLEYGSKDTYEYQVGDKPSAGRAVGHVVGFILTLGLWELFFTPIEAMQGDNKTVVIEYNQNNRVVDINNVE